MAKKKIRPIEADADSRAAPPRLTGPLVALALAAVFGALSHWKVFEYDAFFDARWGREILETGRVQKTDTWSHTAFGRECVNFEWLSTVAIYLASRVQRDYEFLGWLRSLLVGFWIWTLARLAQRGARSAFGQVLIPLALIPWIYLVASFRLQMRPDLFATAHYVALLALWHSEAALARKRGASLAILLSWANFHAGTAPIGIFFFGAMVALGPKPAGPEAWRRKLAWLGAGLGTWFLTPIGFAPVSILLETMLHYDQALWQNPDFQPLSAKLFEFAHGGWVFPLWAAFCAAALLSYAYLVAERPRALPAPYRPRGVVPVVGLALTLMVFNKIRIIHYQVAFLLPLIAAALGALTDHGAWRARRGLLAALGATLVFLWTFALPDQVRYTAKPIGRGLEETELPVRSVAFIAAHRPERNLLNAFAYGGYLVAELPDYPVSIDGRGPFADFLRESQRASASPADYAEFLRRHSIQTVLAVPPLAAYDPRRGFVDRDELLYPEAEWAQVFMDNASVVYVRRTPAHRALIERFAYRYVRRGYPPTYGAHFAGLSDAFRAGFEAELDRCLTEVPDHVYCLLGKAAFLRKRGDRAGALERLTRARAVRPLDPETRMTLSTLQAELGDEAGARENRRAFERLTHHVSPRS